VTECGDATNIAWPAKDAALGDFLTMAPLRIAIIKYL
jgi:hypothetical protein